MTEFKGRKRFTIHRNDASQEAYTDRYVQWLEAELAASQDMSETRKVMLKAHIAENVTHLCVERDQLKPLAALVNEVAVPLYFGFMVCESFLGKAEVRIKFSDLRHAQRLHRALVMIQVENAKDRQLKTCPSCDGQGDVQLHDEGGNGMYWQCQACAGKGKVEP